MQLGPGIGGLLKLDKLKLQQLSFESSCVSPILGSNMSYSGASTYHPARQRPQVELSLNSGYVLDYFSCMKSSLAHACHMSLSYDHMISYDHNCSLPVCTYL